MKKHIIIGLLAVLLLSSMVSAAPFRVYGTYDSFFNVETSEYNISVREGVICNYRMFNLTLPKYDYTSCTASVNSSGLGALRGSSTYYIASGLVNTGCSLLTNSTNYMVFNCSNPAGGYNNWTFYDTYFTLNQTVTTATYQSANHYRSGNITNNWNGTSNLNSTSTVSAVSSFGVSAVTHNYTQALANHTLLISWDEDVKTSYDYQVGSSPIMSIGRSSLISAGSVLNLKYDIKEINNSYPYPSNVLKVIQEFKNATVTSSTTLYINISNPSCSNSYTRTQATNPGTPWCDLNTTSAINNDTVFIANGIYRNTNGFTFTSKNYTSTVTYVGQNQDLVILTSSYSGLEVNNTLWNNQSNSTINLWNTTHITGSSAAVGCYYKNNATPLFVYSSYAALTNMNGYADGVTGEGTYFDSTNDVLYLKLNDKRTPRNISLECTKSPVISLTDSKGITFTNFTVRGGYQGITAKSSATPSNHIKVDKLKIFTSHGLGAIDFRNGLNYTITNNNITSSRPGDWDWNDMKGSYAQESAGIRTENTGNNVTIDHNFVNGYFNGMILVTTSAGKSCGLRAWNNTIRDTYDDAVELEDYGCAYNITGNDIFNAFVSLSMAPWNSSRAKSYITNNLWLSERLVNWNNSVRFYRGECIKLADSEGAENFVFDHNTCYVDKTMYTATGYTNTLRNATFTNNIFYTFGGDSGYALDKSGLASRDVDYDYNIYYRSNGTGLFRYWNSDTSSTVYNTLSSAKASAAWNGIWDLNSLNQIVNFYNPFDNDFRILTGYPECTADSSGSYLGARPCVDDGSVMFVYINTSQNNSVWGTYNNGSYSFYFDENRNRDANCTLYINGIDYNTTNGLSVDDIHYLKPNQSITNGDYLAWINCTTDYGTVAKSEVLNLIIEAPTQRVTDLQVTDYSLNYISVSWVNPETANWNYNEVWLNNVYQGTTTGTTYTFNGLASGTSYNITVLAYDVDGNYGTSSITGSTRTFPIAQYSYSSGNSSYYACAYNGASIDGKNAFDGDWTTASTLGATLSTGADFVMCQATTNITYLESNPKPSVVYFNFRSNSAFTSYPLNRTQLYNENWIEYNFTAIGGDMLRVRFRNSTNGWQQIFTEPNPLNGQPVWYEANITYYQNTSQELAITGLTTLNGSAINSATICNSATGNCTSGNLPLYLAMFNGTNPLTITTTANWPYTTTYTSTGNQSTTFNQIGNTYINWLRQVDNGSITNPLCYYDSDTTQLITTNGNYYYFAPGDTTIYCQAYTRTEPYTLTINSGETLNTTLTFNWSGATITYKDADTLNTVLVASLELYYFSGDYYTNYSTTTGTNTVYYPFPGTYNLRYTSPGYTTRYYYITVDNDTIMPLTLYLINTTQASNITVTILDEVANPVKEAVVKALRFDTTTATFILQEIGITDNSGETRLTLTKNDEYYKFVVEYPAGTTRTTTSPAYITSDTLTIAINLESSIGTDYINYKSIDYTFVFNTATNNFRLDYNDVDGITSEFCVYAYEFKNGNNAYYNGSCSSSATGTILVGVTPVNGSTFTGYAYYYEDGSQKLLAIASYEYPDATTLIPANYSLLGLFLMFMLVVSVIFLSGSIDLGLILAPIMLILGKIIGLHSLGWQAIIPVTILAIIILYFVRRKA